MNYNINIDNNVAWNLDVFFKDYMLINLIEQKYSYSKIDLDIIEKSIVAFNPEEEPKQEDYDFSIKMKSRNKTSYFSVDNEKEEERYTNDIKEYHKKINNALIIYGTEYLPNLKNDDFKHFLSRGVDVFQKMHRTGVSNIIIEELESLGKLDPKKVGHSDEELEMARKYWDETLTEMKVGLISLDVETHKKGCLLFAKFYRSLWD